MSKIIFRISRFLRGYSFLDESKEELYLKSIWDQNKYAIQILSIIQLVHLIYLTIYSLILQPLILFNGLFLFGVYLPITLIVLALSFWRDGGPTTSVHLRRFWYFTLTICCFMIYLSITLKNRLCYLKDQPAQTCSITNRPGLISFQIFSLIGPILFLLVYRVPRFPILIAMIIGVVFSTVIEYLDGNYQITIITLLFQIGSYLFWMYLSYNQENSERTNFSLQFELKEQIARVNASMLREREMDRKRTQFTSYIFHEVRVPLNTVVLNLNLMENDELFMKKLSEADLEYIDRLKSGLNSVENILNDALDFRKMSEGKFKLVYKSYNLITCVKNLTWSMRNSWISKMIELQTTIDPDFNNLKYLLIGDELRLRQILANYLSNAIKFCNVRGHIKVHIKNLSRSFKDIMPNEVVRIYIEVEDTGIGISDEDQKLLFQPYVQLNSSVYKQGSGTGLGLSLCAHLINMFKGKYGVKSKVGVGSIFWMELPFIVSETINTNEKTQNVNTLVIQEVKQRLNVLICDDNMLTLKLMSRIMSKLGHDSNTAFDGIDALDKLKRAQNENKLYDLIFMDNQMPRLNGKETILEMRRLGFTLPIVTITGDAQIEDQEELLRAGSNYVMTKPCTIEKIQKIIQILPINKI